MDYEIETFLEIADDAWLTVLDITGIPVVREPVVVADETGPYEIRPGWSSYYQYGLSVRLNVRVFEMSRRDVAALLRHEFSHLAAGDEYGDSESFVLTEGTAMYVQELCEPQMGDRSDISHALGLTNVEVVAEWRDGLLSDDDVNELYELSGDFARYWIERFGLESWYTLYTRIDCDHAAVSVEAVCGIPLEGICDEFRYYH
jgi:hypothetical protein